MISLYNVPFTVLLLTSEYSNHKVIISILTNSYCLCTSSDRIQYKYCTDHFLPHCI